MTLSLKIDWLNVVVPAEAVERVRALADQLLGAAEDRPYGVHRYRRSAKWETGAVLAWDPELPHALLSLNGDTCSLVPPDRWRPLLAQLLELGGRGTRVDLAVDDHSRQLLDVDTVRAAAESYNFRGFRFWEPSRQIKQTRAGAVLLSNAVTFGRKGKAGGESQCIVYDKALESKGAVNAVRLEARFFKAKAALVVDALASSSSDDRMWEKARALAGGVIDFLDRGTHRHLSRMKRLPWWERVLEALSSAVVKVHRSTPPLLAAALTLKRQWGRTVALIADLVEETGHDAREVLWAMLVTPNRHSVKGWREGARRLGLDVGSLVAPATQGVPRG